MNHLVDGDHREAALLQVVGERDGVVRDHLFPGGGAAEARVSGVKAAALLIQQRVARIKGEAVGEATIDLGLERVRPPAAEIGVPREVRSQFRERAAGRIRLRDNAVAVIRATGIAVLVARAERRGVGR